MPEGSTGSPFSYEVAIDSPSRESIEIEDPLLRKWRNIARVNKKLHEGARGYFKNLADLSVISAVLLGSTGGLINIMLGILDESRFGLAVDVGQIVLGATSLVSAGIISCSKQLGWETKHQLHEEYSARYNEVVRMINTECALVRIESPTFASMADFIKEVHNEITRIEDHAPPVPGFLAAV